MDTLTCGILSTETLPAKQHIPILFSVDLVPANFRSDRWLLNRYEQTFPDRLQRAWLGSNAGLICQAARGGLERLTYVSSDAAGL
jgi:hypothetical protein